MKLIDNSLVGEKAAVKQATDRLHVLVDALTRAGSVTTVQALSSLTEVVIIRTSSSLLPLVLLQPGHLYTEARGGQLRVQFINADITQQQVKAIVNPTNSRLLFRRWAICCHCTSCWRQTMLHSVSRVCNDMVSCPRCRVEPQVAASYTLSYVIHMQRDFVRRVTGVMLRL
jgi:hypothetical protein